MSKESNPDSPSRHSHYKVWLGIEIHGRKPTHYELLGLPRGAIDAVKVKKAALERSAKVRQYQSGGNDEQATQLLNELIAAEWVLTDPERKSKYDATLSSAEPTQAPGPQTAPTSQQPFSQGSSTDPERVVKVHSLQISLDSSTGYGIKEPEGKGGEAGFDWKQSEAKGGPARKQWHVFGYAISAASIITLSIGGLALWMALNAPSGPDSHRGGVVAIPETRNYSGMEFRSNAQRGSTVGPGAPSSVISPPAVKDPSATGNSNDAANMKPDHAEALANAKEQFHTEIARLRQEHKENYQSARKAYMATMSGEIEKAMAKKDSALASSLKNMMEDFTGRESINRMTHPLKAILNDSVWRWDILANKVKLNRDYTVNANWMGPVDRGRWYINDDNTVTWWHPGHGWVTEMRFNDSFTSHQSQVPAKKDLGRTGKRLN